MKPITILLLLIFLFKGIISHSQSAGYLPASLPKKLNSLKAGEALPDITVKPLDLMPVRLADYKGKLIILDFWGVNCSSCIKAMPEMQFLQNKYAGKVQIFLVTKNDSFKVREVFRKLKILKPISLPIISNDTDLSKLFVYQSVPTHVWIDTNGIVLAKTAGYNTNAETISDFFNGKSVTLNEKEEFDDFEWGKPLFTEGAGRQVDRIKFYSIITGMLNGLDGLSDSRKEFDSASGKLIRVLKSNNTLFELYSFAYAEGNRERNFVYDRNRAVIPGSASELFDFPMDKTKIDKWKTKNLYSYEIRVPPSHSKQIYPIMQSDLTRFFGFSAKLERRKLRCWVLQSIRDQDQPVNSAIRRQLAAPQQQKAATYSLSFSVFVDLLQAQHSRSGIPVLNEAAFSGKIEYDANDSFADWVTVNSILKKYGIKLAEEEREIEMLVIYTN